MLNLDEPAPDFVADTCDGKISLSSFRGKWIVLFAYPADFTPICEMDVVGFARNKSRFDDLRIQFIGWSVDTLESHRKWISEMKERTGLEISYPLIADVDGKLAKRYDILHRSKGVTYRGVFIIDPDGILKFCATYPMDVGRSVKEVERIVRVLQRARELDRLEGLDRSRELRIYNSPDQNAERQDTLEEAKRIIGAAEKNGITLRLIGGLAIRVHCHGLHSAHLRAFHDVDVFGFAKEQKGILAVFEGLGYDPNLRFNSNYGTERLQFLGTGQAKNVDVFLDKFRMEHTLDFRERLRLDDLTIPITDLLLTKLQIDRPDPKDANDIVAILEDHDLGHSDDREILNVEYIADLCSRDWGLFKSVTSSLEQVKQAIQDGISVQCIGMEASEFDRKLGIILDSLVSRKKNFRWKARSLVGEKVKWYKEVEEGLAEV